MLFFLAFLPDCRLSYWHGLVDFAPLLLLITLTGSESTTIPIFRNTEPGCIRNSMPRIELHWIHRGSKTSLLYTEEEPDDHHCSLRTIQLICIAFDEHAL